MTKEDNEPHAPSGWVCLVAHYEIDKDGGRKFLPPCIRCKTCWSYIRPEDMGDPCPGPREEDR